MKSVLPEEFKALALEILLDFDKVCKENNIRYTLTYGTLLGAVRHKGYIPWDDDIDIMMLREDYNKLLQVASLQLKSNHKFVSIETEKEFTAPLAKIIDTNTILKQTRHAAERILLGVYIDIFIWDEVPDDLKKRQYLYRKMSFLQKAWGFCENRPSEKDSFLVSKVRTLCNKTKLARLFSLLLKKQAISDKNSGENTTGLMFGDNLQNTVCELSKEDFAELIDMEFEGYYFKVLKKYEYCLIKWYGDYMQFPPKEERVSIHDYTVFYKE